MRFVFISLLAVLAFLLEPVVSSLLGGATLRPDILLLPVVAAVIACPGSWAVILGGLIGLVCDCLAGATVGPQMAAFSLIASVASLMTRPRSVVGVFVLSFVCAAGLETAIAAIRLAQNGRPVFELPPAIEIAGPALMTAIVIGGVWLAAWQLTRPFARRRLDGGRRIAIGWQRSAD
jgi:rod shape-determining protein MreD